MSTTTQKSSTKKEKLKNANLKAANAEAKKLPIEKPSMYVYAEGMTQEEKKTFRRTVRNKLSQLEAKIAKLGLEPTKVNRAAIKELNGEIAKYKAECHNPAYK